MSDTRGPFEWMRSAMRRGASRAAAREASGDGDGGSAAAVGSTEAAQLQEIEALILSRGIDPKEAAAIAPLCRTAMRLDFEPCDASQRAVAASWFGGAPDLPRGFDWPRRGNRRFLSFIAQINLAECAGKLDELWPREGMLLFFFDMAEAPRGESLHDFDACCVRYLNGEVVARMRSGEDLAPLRPRPQPAAPSFRITTVPVLSWPDTHDVRRAANDKRMKLEHYNTTLLQEQRHGMPSQLGGHANEKQDGGARTAALLHSGIDRHHIPAGHPAHKRFKAKAWSPDWRLAAQIDSSLPGFSGWKYGGDRLYFWAQEECIRDRTFERVWATIDVD